MAPLETTNDTVKILNQLAPLIPIAGTILGPILNIAQQILEKAKVRLIALIVGDLWDQAS